MRYRSTLRLRVISSLIILGLSLVSAFAFIQVKNKLQSIYTYNYYRSNIGPIIARLMFDQALTQSTPETYLNEIGAVATALTEKNIVDEATIFKRDGSIVAISPASPAPLAPVPSSDLFRIEEIDRSSKDNFIYLDTEKKRIFVYISLAPPYAAKFIFSLSNVQEAVNQVYKPLILTGIIVFIICILFGFFLSKSIVGPITILNEATKDIAAGNLDLQVRITTHDELEELSDTFNTMTASLKRMRAIAENANPLTRLPGNLLLQQELENRIRHHRTFVVIHSDLDNFKAFNDKYGLEKGDEAIILTAHILKEAVTTKGNPNDFLGHIGGDDFVLVTTPDKDELLTAHIIERFDADIRQLYNEEDLRRGYIVAKGRDETEKKFPIMTISLSGVTNRNRKLKSYAEITNIAAEVKKKAKAIAKSVYVLDKRSEEENA